MILAERHRVAWFARQRSVPIQCRRRTGAREGITWRSCPGHPTSTLQTGERQGRSDHGEMQRAKKREPDQGNKHAGYPGRVWTFITVDTLAKLRLV